MKASDKIDFADFLEKFPVLELPVTLREEAHLDFSRHNDPLRPPEISHFILPYEDQAPDDLTEFIACFRIPDTHAFHAIVYWRAALMDYQYVLATFTKKGELIDRRVIAGTISDNQSLTWSVATIEEDWEIIIVSGRKRAHQPGYDAASSKATHLELLPDGKIVNI